jgi:uncharacterized membrane protein YesL
MANPCFVTAKQTPLHIFCFVLLNTWFLSYVLIVCIIYLCDARYALGWSWRGGFWRRIWRRPWTIQPRQAIFWSLNVVSHIVVTLLLFLSLDLSCVGPLCDCMLILSMMESLQMLLLYPLSGRVDCTMVMVVSFYLCWCSMLTLSVLSPFDTSPTTPFSAWAYPAGWKGGAHPTLRIRPITYKYWWKKEDRCINHKDLTQTQIPSRIRTRGLLARRGWPAAGEASNRRHWADTATPDIKLEL